MAKLHYSRILDCLFCSVCQCTQEPLNKHVLEHGINGAKSGDPSPSPIQARPFTLSLHSVNLSLRDLTWNGRSARGSANGPGIRTLGVIKTVS